MFGWYFSDKDMKIKMLVGVALLGVAAILMPSKTFALGNICGSTWQCDPGLAYWQIDCGSYTETPYIGPIQPASVTPVVIHPINDIVKNCTPGAPNLTDAVSASHAIGTVATATWTGSVGGSIALKFKPGILAETTGTGTWNVTGGTSSAVANTWTKTWTANFNVPACKIETQVCTIKEWSGNFTQSGNTEWDAKVNDAPTWAWVPHWVSGSGSCGASQATGSATTDALSPGTLDATFANCPNCSGG